jgi:hypothetical protein
LKSARYGTFDRAGSNNLRPQPFSCFLRAFPFPLIGPPTKLAGSAASFGLVVQFRFSAKLICMGNRSNRLTAIQKKNRTSQIFGTWPFSRKTPTLELPWSYPGAPPYIRRPECLPWSYPGAPPYIKCPPWSKLPTLELPWSRAPTLERVPKQSAHPGAISYMRRLPWSYPGVKRLPWSDFLYAAPTLELPWSKAPTLERFPIYSAHPGASS